MNRLRLAVVGAGHLGRIHARLLQDVEAVDLIGVVDPDQIAREQVAESSQTRPFASHHDLFGLIDAAIVASPTQSHHVVASELLNHGIHVLVEKPIAVTIGQADDLVHLASEKNLVLQVGHVERFNPALEAALPNIDNAKYIEAIRTSSFTFRSTDVGVVLDLMIHDLDIVMALAASPVIEVHALGLTLFGPHEDMAQARLVFKNGCVANLTASRTSFEAQRKMQVYSHAGYTQIDFAQQQIKTINPCHELLAGRYDVNNLSDQKKDYLKNHLFTEVLPLQQKEVKKGNAILQEQRDFTNSIRTHHAPRVTGQQGRDVLAVAETILEKIAAHQFDGTMSGQIGPKLLPLPTSNETMSFPISPASRRKAG